MIVWQPLYASEKGRVEILPGRPPLCFHDNAMWWHLDIVRTRPSGPIVIIFGRFYEVIDQTPLRFTCQTVEEACRRYDEIKAHPERALALAKL